MISAKQAPQPTPKTIAIFCSSLRADKLPFKDPYYWDAYSDLVLLLTELGARAYLVEDNGTYAGEGVFTKAYVLTAKGPVASLRNVGTIRADLVFDRGGFTGRDVAVINPDIVTETGASKINTYKLFGQYQPFSIPCASEAEVIAALQTIPGELIVIKADRGLGGRQVYVGPKTGALESLPADYPLLIQQFIDTSGGVPGLVEGMHDLRVEVGGGEIWGCYIRMPKAGEYKANIAQGGSKVILSHRDVPAEVARLVHEIDAYFGDMPRFYGIDFARTSEGWKLIEINSRRLGLVAKSGGPGSAYTLQRLAEYLVDMCPAPNLRPVLS